MASSAPTCNLVCMPPPPYVEKVAHWVQTGRVPCIALPTAPLISESRASSLQVVVSASDALSMTNPDKLKAFFFRGAASLASGEKQQYAGVLAETVLAEPTPLPALRPSRPPCLRSSLTPSLPPSLRPSLPPCVRASLPPCLPPLHSSTRCARLRFPPPPRPGQVLFLRRQVAAREAQGRRLYTVHAPSRHRTLRPRHSPSRPPLPVSRRRGTAP